MSIKGFNQSESYKWFGTFWFPDETKEPHEKMSGEISYSPEQGIRIKMLKGFVNEDIHAKPIYKKIMHGIIKDAKPESITILNVGLSFGFQIGNPSCTTLSGSAQGIIANDFHESLNFEMLSLQYDDHFNNIFLYPINKETQAIEFSRATAIQTNSGYQISADVNSTGKVIFSKEDLDSVFFSPDKAVLEQIKNALEPIFDNKSNILATRTETSFSVQIKKSDTEFRKFFEIEKVWRNYWEMVIDHPISIQSAWVHIPREKNDPNGKAQYDKRPFLSSFLTPALSRKESRILQHLDINFYSYGLNNRSLSNIQEYINKWVGINSDPEWEPVIDGLKRSLDHDDMFTDRSGFVSLIAEIETFLDLIGQSDTSPDTLIKLYATEKWQSEFKELHKNLPQSETSGKWIAEIRNSITHPTKTRAKAQGKYRAVASNELLLQKTYAYVIGLLVKGVLSHIGGLSDEILEKFTQKFIETRSAFFPVEFK